MARAGSQRRRRSATAWVAVSDFDRLPGICVKSGAPTALRMGVVAEHIPGALRWMAVFNVWSFLFGRTRGAAHDPSEGRPGGRVRRVRVRVPVSEAAFRSHRYWQVGCASAFFCGVGAGAVGSVAAWTPVSVVGWTLAVVALLVGARAWRTTWVGLFVDRSGREVTVTGCHPDFARAAGELAAARGTGAPGSALGSAFGSAFGSAWRAGRSSARTRPARWPSSPGRRGR